MRRFTGYMGLFWGVATVFLLVAAAAHATHPRPQGATPMRLPLVPAYSACTAPNRTHGAPLAFPSCSPPAQTSGQATVGTPDAYGGPANFIGNIRLSKALTTPGPPNEADILIRIPLTDVRCLPTGASCGTLNASGPADYSGEVRFAFTTRITDHSSSIGPGPGTDAATVEDTSIEHGSPIACAETASTSTGSTCNLSTSVNVFIPGAVREDLRATWEVDEVRVYDSGADGDGDTTADNTVFVRPGIFIP